MSTLWQGIEAGAARDPESMTTMLLAGAVPVIRAARINPVDALRAE